MSGPLHLFEGYGIELEYMIVDADTLSVRPIADRVLEAAGGSGEVEVERGAWAWSNELALHVVELKTNGPAPDLAGLAAGFQQELAAVEAVLAPLGARILAGPMHPWMDPHTELRLWPHENDVVYRTYDRIFDCRGHGWANLQSMHVNLPFADDGEFARLHAAIRLVLPLLPALAAGSPVVDGHATGLCDSRLDVYRRNQARVPLVSGRVVPEQVWDRATYEGVLLRSIYDQIAPLDPEGTLHHEWLNSRGCIARFDRMALEIRLLDVQECPAADLAIAAAVVAVIRALVEERTASLATQQGFAVDELVPLLDATIRRADEAELGDERLLRALGWDGPARVRAGELWAALCERWLPAEERDPAWDPALAAILDHGCLARRILRALGPGFDRPRLAEVYARLADCLRHGRPFLPDAS
ncbi:MAG: glutamate-cysteine ligase family protein [Planctomycetota bacterium]